MLRNRLTRLDFDRHHDIFHPGMSILHTAPKNLLGTRLRSIEGVDYPGGTLPGESGPERIGPTDPSRGST